MPGLAASSKIFEYIELPKDLYELHFFEWVLPEDDHENLEEYAGRYLPLIRHKNPVLIGVSFGGILVQEISRLLPVLKVIIISSIKNKEEMPKRLRFLKASGVYKLFPYRKLSKIDDFSKYEFHPQLKNKGELYNKYLSIRDEKYLNWAIRNVLSWNHAPTGKNVIHIHGTKDEIFPYKHIKECIEVEGGTHAMIIVKARKISKIIENLLQV